MHWTTQSDGSLNRMQQQDSKNRSDKHIADEKNKVEREKIELKREEMQLQEQEQQTKMILNVGLISIGGILALTVMVFVFVKLFRRPKSKSKS